MSRNLLNNVLFTFSIIILFISACTVPDPVLKITVSNQEPVVGEEVTISSTDSEHIIFNYFEIKSSGNSTYYAKIEEETFNHTFDEVGVYEVELTADSEANNGLYQTTSIEINVLPKPISNGIIYQGDNNELSKCYLLTIGELFPGVYDYEMVLTSNGIDYNTQSGEFTGTGNYVSFHLYSNNASNIDNGDYTNYTGPEPTNGSVDMETIYLNNDMATFNGTLVEVEGSTITISDEDGEKKVEGTFNVLNSNETCELLYKGNFDLINLKK